MAFEFDHAAAREDALALAKGLGGRYNIIALCRFCCFVLAIVAGAAAIQTPGVLPLIGLIISGGLFLGLAMWHGLIDDRRRRSDALAAYHQRGSERLAGNWQHGQDDGSAHIAKDHAFAADLDLIGPGGLFALLNTAGSRQGIATLARWLFQEREVASAERVEMVQALVPHHAWRAGLAVQAGDEHRRGRDDTHALSVQDAFVSWLAERTQQWRRLVPLMWLGRLLIAAILVWAFMRGVDAGLLFCLVMGIVAMPVERLAITFSGLADPDQLRRTVLAQAGALRQLAEVPNPHGQMQDLVARAETAATALEELGQIADAAAKRANALRALCAALVLIEWKNLSALHAWADKWGEQYEDFLALLGEGEALACLATYAAEQGGCWPEQITAGPVIDVADLAHPLLPADVRKGNDLQLHNGQVLLLTGANASGKSTFIRSCCLAVVLARIGTTVPASSCRMQLLRLATVMRVSDDLRAGRSRFQAEVERLKHMLDMLDDGQGPVCLALDEILGGTNSKERHLGTQAVLDHAKGGNGVILVSTHDLELTHLADQDPDRFVLAHFADRAALGESDADGADMVFDYQLRSGVLQTTNALRVMQAYGLPVDESAVSG